MWTKASKTEHASNVALVNRDATLLQVLDVAPHLEGEILDEENRK